MLVERGFLHKPQGRPALLVLAPLPDLLADLAASVQRAAEQRQEQLLRLAELLQGHGRPGWISSHALQGLDLPGSSEEFRREQGVSHVDVITPASRWSPFASCPAWRRPRSPRYRVLAPGAADHDRAVPRPVTGELRRHPQTLPALAVVDGARARVDVVVAGVARHGWTFDPVQVRAVASYFEQVWAQAEPVP